MTFHRIGLGHCLLLLGGSCLFCQHIRQHTETCQHTKALSLQFTQSSEEKLGECMWPKVLGKLFKSHKRSAGWHIGLTCTCIVLAIHHFRNVLQRRVDLPKERSCSIKNSTSLSVTLLILCLVLVCERGRVNNIEHTKVSLLCVPY